MKYFILLLIATIIFPLSSFAPKEKKPTCILFMLHQSTRKIEALKKRKMNKEALIVEAEDEDLNNAIMLDFNMNFKFCPIYFFYSDDYENVLAKKWDDVRFVASKENNLASIKVTDYFIAEVNYPPSVKYEIKNGIDTRKESEADAGYANSNDPYGITLHYDNFDLLQSKMVYTNTSIVKLSRKPKKIKFFGAEKLNTRLSNYFKVNNK